MSFLNEVLGNTQTLNPQTPTTQTGGFLSSVLSSNPILPTEQDKLNQLQGQNQVAQANADYASSFKGMLSNTFSGIKDIFKNAGQAALDTSQQTFQNVIDKTKNVFKATDLTNPNTNLPEVLKSAIQLGTAVTGVAFSPVSEVFAAAQKIPGLKQAADIINAPFTVGGRLGGAMGDAFVDALPVSQKTKDTLKPAFNEVGNLGAQIFLGGKVLDEIIKTKDVTPEKVKTLVEDTKAAPESAKVVPTPAPTETPNAVKGGFLDNVNKPTETAPTQKTIPPELQPLAQEAQKYKSAEEFVKSQPTYYHGGTADIKEVSPSKGNYSKTFYLSDNADYAKSYGGKNSVINEMTIDPKANIIDLRKPNEQQIADIKNGIDTLKGKPAKYGEGFSFHPYSEKEVLQGIRDGKAHFAELPEIKKVLKSLGYDGQITTEVPYAKNIGIWNTDVIKTKSQLTDIYNQVTKGEKPITPEAPIQAPSTRGEALLKAAVEKKIIDAYAELPTHNKIDAKQQVNLVSDFVSKNPEEALRVGEGKTLPPQGILASNVYKFLEEKAMREGDIETLYKLKDSYVPTHAGQELQALDSQDPFSPVKIMRDIQSAREAEIAKTGGKRKVIDEINTEIKKAVSKRPSWEEFINSVKCNY